METENPNNGGADPPNPGNVDEFESASSTPFFSAPSSPGRGGGAGAGGFLFFSTPSDPAAAAADSFEFEFEFSDSFPATHSADVLFPNGQIRPMKLSSHLERPQPLAPLLDLDAEEEAEGARRNREAAEVGGRGRDLKRRSRSIHRRAMSLSPLRNLSFRWRLHGAERGERGEDLDQAPDRRPNEAEELRAPPVSASSRSSSSSSTSSSSSSGRSSKRWIFLKGHLHRNRSERSGQGREKFWHAISSLASNDKGKPPVPEPLDKTSTPPVATSEREAEGTSAARPANGVCRRRRAAPSAHERHYSANRAQAEEMRRRTFLPYRQGLLGCLWFNSGSCGAISGFARTLNPVSSR